MHAQVFLEYVVAGAIIIIGVVSIGVGIGIMLLLYEARRALRAVQKTAKGIEDLKESVSSGMIGSVISFGKNLFQKKPRND